MKNDRLDRLGARSSTLPLRKTGFRSFFFIWTGSSLIHNTAQQVAARGLRLTSTRCILKSGWVRDRPGNPDREWRQSCGRNKIQFFLHRSGCQCLVVNICPAYDVRQYDPEFLNITALVDELFVAIFAAVRCKNNTTSKPISALHSWSKTGAVCGKDACTMRWLLHSTDFRNRDFFVN